MSNYQRVLLTLRNAHFFKETSKSSACVQDTPKLGESDQNITHHWEDFRSFPRVSSLAAGVQPIKDLENQVATVRWHKNDLTQSGFKLNSISFRR